jgi:hypothetical protein
MDGSMAGVILTIKDYHISPRRLICTHLNLQQLQYTRGCK